jgi:hypothetical protein
MRMAVQCAGRKPSGSRRVPAGWLPSGMKARRSRHSQGSGQGGIWVPVEKAIRRVVIDERVISEPLHGTAPGPGIPERVPHWQQARILLVWLVFEPAEGSLALDSTCQPALGALIGYSVCEVGHVLVPDPRRQRINHDQVQLIEVDRRLPVDAGVGRPERDLSRVRVDSQWCS